jgi:proteasome accessory factor B
MRRSLGVPLETGTASVFDSEPGYRIAQREYALPAIPLAPDEAAAVGVAARLWRHAGLAAAATSALAKLRAGGVDVDPHATLGVEPVIAVDASFEPLTAAARARQAVTFEYKVPENDASAVRHLQPWGVACWHGRWYVVGHDIDRDAARCFRLSRIVGKVRPIGEPQVFMPPPDVDLISYVARWSGPVERNRTARVLARPGRAAGVRRWAQQCASTPEGDVLDLRYADAEGFATWLVGYGADVTVLEPTEVRDAVIARLREISAMMGGETAVPASPVPASPVQAPPIPAPAAPVTPPAAVVVTVVGEPDVASRADAGELVEVSG